MKVLYKITYNVICDTLSYTTHSCEEHGSTYECSTTYERFPKNSVNTLKKVTGGYEMLVEDCDEGVIMFTNKIIAEMDKEISRLKTLQNECHAIKARAVLRREKSLEMIASNHE